MASWLQDVLRRSETALPSADGTDPSRLRPAPLLALRAQFGDYAAAAERELSRAAAEENSVLDTAADEPSSAPNGEMGAAKNLAAGETWRLRDALASASAEALDDRFALEHGLSHPEANAAAPIDAIADPLIPVSPAVLPASLTAAPPRTA